MPLEQLIFFAIWLALALLAGALIVAVWRRLRRGRDGLNRH
jgi:hypothetical protein